MMMSINLFSGIEYCKNIIRLIISPIWLLDESVNSATRNVLTECIKADTFWLDVGCGLKPFASSFECANYVGIDIEVSGRPIDMKRPDKYFDGLNIPYGDDKFDGILCTQVLEHVEKLDHLIYECNRVIKLGGEFIVSVPFVYREHEQPYDFRRFTSYGLISLMEHGGFKVVLSLKCLSAIETIATTFCVYISNNIGSKKNRLLLVFFSLFLFTLY